MIDMQEGELSLLFTEYYEARVDELNSLGQVEQVESLHDLQGRD